MTESHCKCGKPFVKYAGTIQTLVGYGRESNGHLHDDNCRWRIYLCEDEHQTKLYVQNRCPDCDWRGRTTCGCHAGEKLGEWPVDVPSAEREEAIQILLACP